MKQWAKLSKTKSKKFKNSNWKKKENKNKTEMKRKTKFIISYFFSRYNNKLFLFFFLCMYFYI